jgi:hypothetical protein
MSFNPAWSRLKKLYLIAPEGTAFGYLKEFALQGR